MNKRAMGWLLFGIVPALIPVILLFNNPKAGRDFKIVTTDLNAVSLTAGDEPFKTGLRFYSGIGTDKDIAHAMHWWLIAAERGSADAQHNLGVMYTNGEGVSRDYVQAYMWFDLAVKFGNRSAHQKGVAIARHMKPEEFDEAQERVRQWMRKHRY